MTAGFDAVVIGAGHNGLVCAAYLCRAGFKTLVVERSDRIGGACVTEEPWPGFRMSTGVHSLSLFGPQVVTDLGLDLPVLARDPVTFAPFEDGGGLLLWSDDNRARAEIASFSHGDADGYGELNALFDAAARRLRPLWSYPATKKQVLRALRQAGIEKLYRKVVGSSIAEVCREFLTTDILQGLVASTAIVGSVAGPETPGTAYMYLHARMGGSGEPPWPAGSLEGGMGSLALALEEAVRSSGGEVRTGCEVTAVKLEGRRAAGIVLESGEEIDAGTVCSAADPKRTVGFVAHEAWLKEFVQDVDLLPAQGSVVKVNCALRGLPRFRGMSSSAGPGPEHRGSLTIAPSIAHLERSSAAAATGELPQALLVKGLFESVADPGLVPEGKHTLSLLAQYVPHDPASGWDQRREEAGDLVLETLEIYAPGITSLVEHREVLTPPDLEARFGMTGGHIYHGEMLPDWLFDNRPASPWNRYRTPLPGLYMCGAGTHPGGGVTGLPGRNAARAVVEDHVAAAREPGV